MEGISVSAVSSYRLFANKDSNQLNATEAHLVMAANTHADSLFWTFCSSTNIPNSPPDTPVIQALGNGTLTPSGGVNQQLVPFLKGLHGKRLGIVMFDCMLNIYCYEERC